MKRLFCKFLAFLLAVVMVAALLPGVVLAAEGPDAGANDNLDDIWLLVYFEDEGVPTVVRSDKHLQSELNLNGVQVNWYDYQFGEGTGYSRWKISTLTALFEGLSKGSCTIDGTQEKKIDLSKPIELHFFNKDGANKKISKKLVFAPTSKKPVDAAVAAVDESDTITIYADNFKFVNDSTAIPAGLSVSTQNYENNTIAFENGLQIQSGASVEFSHNANRKYQGSRSWISAQMTCVFSGDLVVDEGGTLSVEGHKAPPQWTVTSPGVAQKPYRGYDYGTIFEFSGTQFTNSGDVTLSGVHVKGESMTEPVIVNNGTLELSKHGSEDGGSRAVSTLVETDSTTTAAVECAASSTLTVKDDSRVKSGFKKAADLKPGSTYSDGTTSTKVGEGYAESYVDNMGSLVLKAHEDDLAAKVDRPSVEANVDKVSESDKEAVTEALDGITAELPMEEQNDAAGEWADEEKAETVKEQLKGATGKEPEATEEVYIHVLTIVETTVETYDKAAGILTLDITPYYEVVATTAADMDDIVLPEESEEGENVNAVELDKKPLQIEVDVPMKIKLPSGFGGGLTGSTKILIIHDHNGKINRYTDTVIDFQNRIVSFTAKGFSTFTVVSLKNGMLFDLTDSTEAMETFDPSKTAYTVNVPNDVTELTLTATTAIRNDTVTAKLGDAELTPAKDETVTGKDVYTITVSDLAVGENIVTITVADGTTYTVTIIRAAVIPPVPNTPMPAAVYPVTVTEPEHGTVTADPTRTAAGGKVALTVTPDTGYELDSLTVTDAAGKAVDAVRNADGTYSFTMPDSGVTVRASFKRTACDGGADCPSRRFKDLDAAAWYHAYTDYVITHDLMHGEDSVTFDPLGTVTRAQMVTTLWNMNGNGVVNYMMPFEDVQEDQWYAEAIRWAASEGIVTGYDARTFGPDDPISREQMAVMLYRYEQKYGDGGFTGAWMFPLGFTDSAKVSDWAYEAVAWCSMNKVVQGKDDGSFDPAGTARRVELATVLTKYLSL